MKTLKLNQISPRTLILVFGILAFLNLMTWVAIVPANEVISNDAGTYFELANSIVDGKLDRSLIRGPTHGSFEDIGYPNLLATLFIMTGKSVFAAQILQGVLYAGITIIGLITLLELIGTGPAFWVGGFLFSLSPMLSSFGPKLYSELFAIFGITLLFWGLIGKFKARYYQAIPLLLGACIIITTKSAFFAIIFIFSLFLILKKKYFEPLILACCLIITYPIQSSVQRAGRGMWELAYSSAKIELQTPTIMAKCAVYRLSYSLGQKLFPESEGACRLNAVPADMPGAELSFYRLGDQWIREGFTYAEGVKRISKHPIKYFFICLANLPSIVLIDGHYKNSVDSLPAWMKPAFAFFRVIFNLALWGLAFGTLKRGLKLRNHLELQWIQYFAFWMILVIGMHLNTHSEQRFYMPLLPMLYILASIRTAQFFTQFFNDKRA